MASEFRTNTLLFYWPIEDVTVELWTLNEEGQKVSKIGTLLPPEEVNNTEFELEAWAKEFLGQAAVAEIVDNTGEPPTITDLPILAEDTYQFKGSDLMELLGQVAGAASGAFLRLDPNLVMPSQEVSEAFQAYCIASAETFSRAHVEPITKAEAQALFDSFAGGSPDGNALSSVTPKLEKIVGEELVP
jgi:hypothetical protein